MGIDLTDKLVETATKVAVTRNEFGDVIYGATTSVACLYQDHSSLLELTNREQITIEGYLWFGAGESVVLGDVYYHPSEGYLRIQQVIKAKTLLTDDVLQFIKCKVTHIRQVS